jgi:hypothetical protein
MSTFGLGTALPPADGRNVGDEYGRLRDLAQDDRDDIDHAALVLGVMVELGAIRVLKPELLTNLRDRLLEARFDELPMPRGIEVVLPGPENVQWIFPGVGA